MEDKIRLGISSCLLGERVRYDGGHKLDSFLKDTLGRYVEYVPVCPEVECGLPVPREAMHLEGDPASPRLIASRTRRDLTARMAEWAKRRVAELEEEELCGFIFKSRSPSSGMARVRIFNDKGMPANTGPGIFGRAFMEHFPLLPVEDEGRLRDPKLRENFIELIFTLNRWRETLAGKKTPGALVEFHTRHKLLIFSHSEKIYREMGRLVAHGKQTTPARLYEKYQELLVGALRLKTTTAKNVNVRRKRSTSASALLSQN